MNPAITGAITGPNNGAKAKPAKARFLDWGSNKSEITPAPTFKGADPNKPPTNANTNIWAVFWLKPQAKLKKNESHMEMSKTGFLPMKSYSLKGAITSGPTAHARIWIDTINEETVGLVIPKSIEIFETAGDNIEEDMGLTNA